jgi:hypothetical protein
MQINEDEHLVLSGERLSGASFAGRRLEQLSAEGCRFEDCRFDSAVIESASFGAGRRVSEYVGCNFDGARLRMGPGGYARFVGCTFDETTIEHWFCFTVELVDCTFSGRLTKVVFNGAVPDDKRAVAGRLTNQFEGNDFSEAKLVDVSFRTGIDLSRQRLPAGSEYVYLDDAPVQVKRARIAYNAWDDAEAKKRARGVLAVMEEDVAAGQRQLMIRIDDYPRPARPAIQALLAAARAF